MNDQERQVIADIFRRLEQVAGQTRDPEAERFIADRVRAQPYAPYAMAQAIYVQEQALANLNAQVEQLAAELEEARRAGSGSGGFLSSLFGGGSREPERRPGGFGQGYGDPRGQDPGGYQQGGAQGGPWGGQSQPGPQGGPWGGQQQPQAGGFGAGRGGGFLGTALTTAAGVAGGMFIGNALANAFGGGEGAKNALGNLGGGDKAAEAGSSDHSQFSPFGEQKGGQEHAAQEQHASHDAGGHDDDGGDFDGGGFDGGDFA